MALGLRGTFRRGVATDVAFGAEFATVTLAIDLMWDAAADLAQMRMQQQWSWLEDTASPAFVVDDNLVVRGMNAGFRQLSAIAER